MSYHSQAQTQQRSAGLIAVAVFHLVAALGLFYGFTIKTIPTTDAPLKVDNISEKPKTIDIVDMQPVDMTKVQVSVPKQPDELVFTTETVTPPSVEPIRTGGETVKIQMTKPSILKASKPEYPSASTRLGEEGTTTLSLFINENGRVADARIAKSSGYERLDQAAIKHAMRNWVFTPCTQEGKVFACWHSTNLVWKIENAQR